MHEGINDNCISINGKYNNGNSKSNFGINIEIDKVLNGDIDKINTILNVLNDKEKLFIIISILKVAKTVNELCEELKIDETKKVNNYLNSLLKSNLVIKDNDERYTINSVFLGDFIIILTGIYNFTIDRGFCNVNFEELR